MEHYKNLDIDENASASDIKKAYRGKASKHHPDKGGDSEQFQKIQRAYLVLSDPKRRSRYDASGGQDDQKTSVDTVLAEAYAALGQQFNSVMEQAINNLANVDLVSVITESVLKNRAAFNTQIIQQRQLKAKMEEAKERLSNTSEDKNFVPIFENVIADNIKRIDANVATAERNIEVNVVMEKLLKDYNYRKDEITQSVFYGQISSTGTSTF